MLEKGHLAGQDQDLPFFMVRPRPEPSDVAGRRACTTQTRPHMIDRDFIELQEALAGDYSLERELGRGGMGVVYLAREVQLDRHVAI